MISYCECLRSLLCLHSGTKMQNSKENKNELMMGYACNRLLNNELLLDSQPTRGLMHYRFDHKQQLVVNIQSSN